MPCYFGYSAGFLSKGWFPGREIATAVILHAQKWACLPQDRRKQMRQTVIVAATTALVTAIVASWGTTVIIAHTEKHPEAATASTSIDVMKMMRDAQGLPEEKFDAH